MSATESPELIANWLGALAVAVGATQREAIAQGGNDSQTAALLTLSELPRISVGDLAGILGSTHSACVRLVDGLVADGLVRRTRSESDARRAELTLTANGQRAGGRLQRERLRALDAFLRPLAAEERTQFGHLVERLLSGVAADRMTARRTCRYCAHRLCAGPDCPVGRSVEARC